MGVNRLFVPQDVLDEWVADGKAAVTGEELQIHEEGRAYRLVPAFHFLRESSGAEDPHGVVGRVLEQGDLARLAADAYMDSVIVQDNAYDVANGFVAAPLFEVSSKPRGAPESGEADSTEEDFVDKDELARLLLQHIK